MGGTCSAICIIITITIIYISNSFWLQSELLTAHCSLLNSLPGFELYLKYARHVDFSCGFAGTEIILRHLVCAKGGLNKWPFIFKHFKFPGISISVKKWDLHGY